MGTARERAPVLVPDLQRAPHPGRDRARLATRAQGPAGRVTGDLDHRRVAGEPSRRLRGDANASGVRDESAAVFSTRTISASARVRGVSAGTSKVVRGVSAETSKRARSSAARSRAPSSRSSSTLSRSRPSSVWWTTTFLRSSASSGVSRSARATPRKRRHKVSSTEAGAFVARSTSNASFSGVATRVIARTFGHSGVD